MNTERWKRWLGNLMRTVIHSGAVAGNALWGGNAASGIGIDVKPLDLRQLALVTISAMVASVFLFVSKTPPPLGDDSPTPGP